MKTPFLLLGVLLLLGGAWACQLKVPANFDAAVCTQNYKCCHCKSPSGNVCGPCEDMNCEPDFLSVPTDGDDDKFKVSIKPHKLDDMARRLIVCAKVASHCCGLPPHSCFVREMSGHGLEKMTGIDVTAEDGFDYHIPLDVDKEAPIGEAPGYPAFAKVPGGPGSGIGTVQFYVEHHLLAAIDSKHEPERIKAVCGEQVRPVSGQPSKTVAAYKKRYTQALAQCARWSEQFDPELRFKYHLADRVKGQFNKVALQRQLVRTCVPSMINKSWAAVVANDKLYMSKANYAPNRVKSEIRTPQEWVNNKENIA
eukprot:GILI01005083.1.p2 GENE.GILI01005083.1~~GILI01005083.1.p2  ORF type:complete len:310 (+),score=89.49 GILI01005083.1:60-989(+)